MPVAGRSAGVMPNEVSWNYPAEDKAGLLTSLLASRAARALPSAQKQRPSILTAQSRGARFAGLSLPAPFAATSAGGFALGLGFS